MKRICTGLILLLAAICCNAQSNRKPATATKLIKTQGTNEYAAVGCSMQDRAGNLWFGTSGEGVYRYDGHTFTNFTEQNGLCSNNVCSMLEDRKGNIWLGSNKGLCCFEHVNRSGLGMLPSISDKGKFTSIAIPPATGTSAYAFAGGTYAGITTGVFSMLQDRSGKLWFGTYEGVYCYDPSVAGPVVLTRFLDGQHIVNNNGIRLRAVTSILEDKAGNIWFTTWFEGICRYDGKTLTNYKPNGEVWYSGMLEDRAGRIWFGRRDKGVCRYDPTASYDAVTFTNILQHGIFDSCSGGPMAEDKEGNIWFCAEPGDMTKRETEGGAWRYDGRSFKNLTMKDGLPNMIIFSVMVDRSGKVWFGTRNVGLCCYDPKHPKGEDGKALTRYSE